MTYAEFSRGRDFLVRAEHDSDLIQNLAELAEKRKIAAASFTAIGALTRAKLAFYDQENHKYREVQLDSPHEIASCTGNISIKNGKPFVHAHAVLADKTGHAKAGHLIEGIVFAVEIHLRDLKGSRLDRKHDETTGLSLWTTP